jgi:hypothetical protein
MELVSILSQMNPVHIITLCLTFYHRNFSVVIFAYFAVLAHLFNIHSGVTGCFCCFQDVPKANTQRVPRRTHSSFPSLDKNMLALASNALHGIRISTQPEFCQPCYYAVSLFLFIFYSYHCTCNWHTKLSSLCFCSRNIIHKSVSCSHLQ